MPHDPRAQADPYRVYEVAPDIYWVGFADRHAGFSNNPYLIRCGGEAVLIDPGSVLHYHVVAKKVLSLVRPDQIRTIILQHQDPDLCASVPRFEALVERPLRVLVHKRTALFMPYYGITSELVSPEDGEAVELGGVRFEFWHTPYVHFAGAWMTWHPASRTLFASDVFGGLTTHWRLYADDSYAEATRAFAEPYYASAEAWRTAIARTRALRPARICPQHGSIIEGPDIAPYLDRVSTFQLGRLLPTLKEMPS